MRHGFIVIWALVGALYGCDQQASIEEAMEVVPCTFSFGDGTCHAPCAEDRDSSEQTCIADELGTEGDERTGLTCSATFSWRGMRGCCRTNVNLSCPTPPDCPTTPNLSFWLCR